MTLSHYIHTHTHTHTRTSRELSRTILKIRIGSKVLWDNSNHQRKNPFYFCLYSFILHYQKMIFGSQVVVRTVLYVLTREFSKNHILEKSNHKNDKVELS